MSISVRLPVFEGPLDLLLHLIDRNQVEISDIPIAEITDQYLEYIRSMQHRDLDAASEFLVMAATLLDIKARMLLPKEEQEEEGEEDPREELVQRLLEYKMYKYMSAELRDRQQDAEQVLYHRRDMPKEVQAWEQPVHAEDLLDGVTLFSMYRMFQDILRRQDDRVDPIRSKFGTVEKEEVDMAATREWMEAYLKEHGTGSFREMLSGHRGRMQTIVVFLVLLDLMKEGEVLVTQEEAFSDIRIYRCKAEDGRELS